VGGSYAEESSAVYNLLQDLKKKYAADITLLGFKKWVDALDAAETAFLAARTERTKEDIGKPKEHLKDIRQRVDDLYKGITEILHAKLLADGLAGDILVDPEDLNTGAYDSTVPKEQRGNIVYNFVIAWNEILKKYHNLLATRAGRRAKSDEPDPDEPDSPPED
jgi:hypothetical protein